MKITLSHIKNYLLLLIVLSCKNINDEQKNEVSSGHINSELIQLNLPVANIAVLGTFHFVANVDSYKRKNNIDVMSPKIQKELDELVNTLSYYKPTKILVEFPIAEQKELDSLYQEYRKGNYKLGHGEQMQIGFRLAKLLNHEHVYGVDVQVPLDLEYPVEDWMAYAEENGEAVKLNKVNEKFDGFYAYNDSLKMTMPLLKYYAYLNSNEVILANDQQKLSGWIEVGAGDKYLGADLVTHDYRRNLRIYANIVSLIENDNDRFLLIIGSSHTRILRHFLEDGLEFNYTNISDYLNSGTDKI